MSDQDAVVQELRAIRSRLFWGPFWAIIATGVVGAGAWGLYLVALQFVAAARA